MTNSSRLSRTIASRQARRRHRSICLRSCCCWGRSRGATSLLLLVLGLFFSMLLLVLLVVRQHVRLLVSSSWTEKQQQPHGDESKRNHRRHNINRMKYTGSFGLGHRLSKLTAAHHLALKTLHLPLLQVEWGSCGDDSDKGGDNPQQQQQQDIFAYLFGSTEIVLRDPSAAAADFEGKVVWVRNDVRGYYAGQAYKNFEIPLTTQDGGVGVVEQQWNQKLQHDATFLRDLLEHRFTGRAAVLKFQRQHAWHERTVIGIHLRAGNGERDHFAAAARDVALLSFNDTAHQKQRQQFETAETIQQLLAQLWYELQQQQQQQQFSNTLQPPLVFLATDTASWIPVLQQALAPIFPDVVVLEQPRVPEGQGVSYQTWRSEQEQCEKGWMAAATDMALLASADVVIAATRSTFTQIAPLALVLDRSQQQHKVQQPRWSFCEMELPAARMTCFRDATSWLFRRPAPASAAAWITFATEGGTTTTTTTDHHDEAAPMVTHKLMVHLQDPTTILSAVDPVPAAALQFLQDASVQNETLYYYGRKFNPKYRAKRSFREDWTWAASGNNKNTTTENG